MKATFVELRTKSTEILEALERNESVTILYRGRPKAVMQPIGESQRSTVSVVTHPAFGLWKDYSDMDDVAAQLRTLRQGRFDAR